MSNLILNSNANINFINLNFNQIENIDFLFNCSQTKEISLKNNRILKMNFDILKNFHSLPPTKKLKEGEPQPIMVRDMVNEKFDLCIVDEAHNLTGNEYGEALKKIIKEFG